jgi:CMP-N,N'-diacetyllegionaminic acid synthase
MIEHEKIMAIIPARAGSRGVKNKNILPLAGQPLIAWTINAALNASYLDKVMVSTDGEEIAQIAKQFGAEVPFMRASTLAEDETTTMEVVLDVMDRYPGYDWVVVLQPTSPLRTAADIDEAIEYCLQQNAPSCVSITLTQEHPYWMYSLETNHLVPYDNKGVVQRQKLPKLYSLNGAFYLARSEQLLAKNNFITADTVGHVMPYERSIDIDTIIDFRLAEMLMSEQLK